MDRRILSLAKYCYTRHLEGDVFLRLVTTSGIESVVRSGEPGETAVSATLSVSLHRFRSMESVRDSSLTEPDCETE